MRIKPLIIGCMLAEASFSASVTACEGEEIADLELNASSAREQIEQIRARVLRRCGLSSKLAENKLPWYFHYEFGVELLDEGEASLAVESLQMTANLKSEPSRTARMYGMWFIKYMPYYQISLAYSQLGQWDKAWDAIVMSENLVEFSPGHFDYENFTSLKALIEQNHKPES